MKMSHQRHLKLAFFLWAAVGLGLFVAGLVFLAKGESGFDLLRAGLMAVGLAIGLVKSRFVLNKVAKKNIQRIFTLPKDSGFWSTFSLKSWIMVLAMIALGRLIRAVGAPYALVGLIYVAVGFGLALSSRIYLTGRPTVPEG